MASCGYASAGGGYVFVCRLEKDHPGHCVPTPIPLNRRNSDRKKGDTMKVILIPWNEREPVTLHDIRDDATPGGLEDINNLIFGPGKHGVTSVSNIQSHGFGFVYDDNGMSTQPENTNERARKLWARALNTSPDRLLELKGNFLVFGFDNWGETVDVPGFVRDYFAEEGIGSAD